MDNHPFIIPFTLSYLGHWVSGVILLYFYSSKVSILNVDKADPNQTPRLNLLSVLR